ncbi:hypothetical protein AAG570_006900 [Ranatra chinensis]|uniref:Uncharacterized protein n=1 Tax=Ranatra chinensis TaxID=642074 RepID=A0ABD0YVE7_9HEMI
MNAILKIEKWTSWTGSVNINFMRWAPTPQTYYVGCSPTGEVDLSDIDLVIQSCENGHGRGCRRIWAATIREKPSASPFVRTLPEIRQRKVGDLNLRAVFHGLVPRERGRGGGGPSRAGASGAGRGGAGASRAESRAESGAERRAGAGVSVRESCTTWEGGGAWQSIASRQRREERAGRPQPPPEPAPDWATSHVCARLKTLPPPIDIGSILPSSRLPVTATLPLPFLDKLWPDNLSVTGLDYASPPERWIL